MSNRVEVHRRTYFGRPRSQVTALLDHAIRGRSRNQRRVDRYAEAAARIKASLSERDRKTLELYEMAVEDDHALAGFVLSLRWLLGDGLGQLALNHALSEPWGEELTGSYDFDDQR